MEIFHRPPTAKGPTATFTGDVWVDGVYAGPSLELARRRARPLHGPPGLDGRRRQRRTPDRLGRSGHGLRLPGPTHSNPLTRPDTHTEDLP